MKFKTKIIIFSLLILLLSISAASAHENIIADGNDTVTDIIGINHFDDGLDDSLDDWDDDYDLDDEDYEDYDGSDDWDDDYWDDDWDDDSDLDDEDYDWDDDWNYEWNDGDWDGNYTNSSIKFCKLISYSRAPFMAYKTASSLGNMSYGYAGSEDDCEDICGNDSDDGLDNNSDDLNDDYQEESGLVDSQYFMTSCPGASASFEVSDVLSQNHESVSKNINQDHNLLDDEKEDSVNVTDDDKEDYDTIPVSSDNDLDILGLLVSLLLSIILLI